MKNVAIACSLAALFAGAAFAADNYLGSVTTVAQVANCYPTSQVGKRVAIQCKQIGCHVAASSLPDGGGNSTLGTTADTNSILVNAAVLYDLDMNLGGLPYVCVFGQDGGAVKADLYINSGR